MKRQERRGPKRDGDVSDTPTVQEQRPESAQQPVTPTEVRRTVAAAAQNDQLLLEQQISAITARTPPGPQTFTAMTVRCSSANRTSFIRASA
jgi:hypothetical protein